MKRSFNINTTIGAKKHAYLIIAHKNDYTLHTLVSLLDYPGNDIYIHMDINTGKYNQEKIKKLIDYSEVYFIKREKVSWGGYSQINIELSLLEEALKNKPYKYYHLLSGEDLPLVSQDYIHDFFEKNNGKEFVRFNSETFEYESRVRYYHFFQEYLGKKGNIFLKIINKMSLSLQSLIRINRNDNIDFQKGTNWFSITESFAEYVLSKRKWIENTFSYTSCSDEVYMQTILHNSKFKNNLYHSKYDNDCRAIMRYIDWDRGSPYVLRIDDYNELINSKMFFARKFDSNIDKDIVKKIKQDNT